MPTQVGNPLYLSYYATGTFSGLGQKASQPKWFLSIELFDTGFGGPAISSTYEGSMPDHPKQEVAFYARTADAVGYQLLKRCFPEKKLDKGSCPSAAQYNTPPTITTPNPFVLDCLKDYDATELMLNDFGGSLQIYMASAGFDSTSCKYVQGIGSSFVVASRLTLRAEHPNPTFPPVEKPGEEKSHHEDEKVEDDDHYEDGEDDHDHHEIHDAAEASEIEKGIPVESVAIPVGFFIYILMGIRILIVRSQYHSANITPFHGGAVLFYFAIIGIHLCLELTLGIILVESHWLSELGWGIVFSRLCCWVPSFYILGTVFHTGFYEKKLEEEQLSANVITYGIFNIFVISDTQLLCYFPWASTSFSKVNFGIPDKERVHFLLWPKFCQLVISLVCTSIFLDHLHHEIEWVGEQHWDSGDDDYTDDENQLEDDDSDDHEDDEHVSEDDDEDRLHWEEEHMLFLHELLNLYDLVALVLTFTIVIMCTVFYSIAKHFRYINLDQHYTPDMYDDTHQDMTDKSGYGEGDNRFMQRNLEMAHNPIQMPPGGRLSITNQSPPFYGYAPQERAAIQQEQGPDYPYGLEGRRPSFEAGPRIQMQNQLTASSFQGRASLDGRRSSLGTPTDRRPSFNNRLPGGPPPGMHGAPPGY